MAQETTMGRAARQVRQTYSPWRLVLANLYDLRHLLRDSFLGLAGLLVVVLIDSVYLTTVPNPNSAATPKATFSPAEALYEALKLLIFQSSAPLPSDVPGRLVFFLTPILGLGLLVQSASNFGRRLLSKSSRREVWQVALATTYRDHVIICGLGRVGLRVATRLIESGYRVVSIERDWNATMVPRALELNIPVVVGDAREPTILRQAGVMRARGVVAGINSDLLNIEIALAARGLRPRLPVVLRAFDEELDTGVEKVFGTDSTFSTSALAAPTLAAAVLTRGLDHVLPATDGQEPLGVTHLVLPERSAFAGPDAKFEQRYGVRVLATLRGGKSMPWKPATSLRAGDRVEVVGPLAAVEALRQATAAEMASREAPAALAEADRGLRVHTGDAAPTVIICGMGKVGYRVVRLLLQRSPRPRVVVIQLHDDPASLVHRIDDPNVTVIYGDARNHDILRRAGVMDAHSLAAVTADDLVNLQIGLAARAECADVHLVLRVFSDALADRLVDMFGIHTTYSTSDLASPTLAAAAILGGASQAFAAGGLLYTSKEVVARRGDGLAGRTVGDLRQRDERLVIQRCRGDEICLLPELTDTVQPGDRVTVLAPVTALDRMS